MLFQKPPCGHDHFIWWPDQLMRIALVLALVFGLPVTAQSETLADIKRDLGVLTSDLLQLKQELSVSGSAAAGLSGSALDRINAIESELQRVTAKAEQLEFRIGQVVKDGTNRVGDLNFRVCELEPGCDIAALGATAPLGGDAVPAPAGPAAAITGSDALPYDGELAVSEEADFRSAQAALDGNDFAGAADLFALFRETYPQGPLEAAALLGEGRALEGQGDTREAARRYLEVYSVYGKAKVAPEALWRLGVMLAALGSLPEACVTLAEVGAVYPGSSAVSSAQASRAELGCS